MWFTPKLLSTLLPTHTNPPSMNLSICDSNSIHSVTHLYLHINSHLFQSSKQEFSQLFMTSSHIFVNFFHFFRIWYFLDCQACRGQLRSLWWHWKHGTSGTKTQEHSITLQKRFALTIITQNVWYLASSYFTEHRDNIICRLSYGKQCNDDMYAVCQNHPCNHSCL